MVFNLAGSRIVRVFKLSIGNPCFIIPSSVNSQVRHAARKGIREIAKQKKKKAAKQAVATIKENFTTRKKKGSLVKTIERVKPDVPDDDVFIAHIFKHARYSLKEAVQFHKEYHHPTVYNNPEAPISVNIELNLIGKKKTQVLKPFNGVAAIPYPFDITFKKQIMVLCKPEHADEAVNCGASLAGGIELVKKIQSGIIQPSIYDYVLCHIEFLPELAPIRGLLKNQLPKLKFGTATADLKSAIPRFLNGVKYNCMLGENETHGFISSDIGTVNMEADHIEENFRALIKALMEHKVNNEVDFFSWVWCKSPPSPEEFTIDISRYVEKPKVNAEDEDSDDEGQEAMTEEKALKQLMAEKRKQILEQS